MMLCIVSGCTSTTTNYIFKDENKSGIYAIEYDALQEMINNEETFLLYIGREDCLDCNNFYPILEDLLANNEGTYVYYLSILEYRNSAMEEDASLEEIEFYENLQETFEFDWVPSIKMISSGEIVDHYQYLDNDYYEIENEEEQQEELERQLEYFETWILQWFK
ncbi:bacteriocin [Tannockella kyphosi]|uniref:bacteriocin n=1 Tax=Tannockella kyphosi TaxID=2899121 RepID=UPI0020110166|nr:bacteriocin [Tannockella kyphosi]